MSTGPAAPLARTSSVSFVLLSPSMLMLLKLNATALRNKSASTSAAISASVTTIASMVAMFGWIIPAPFAMPYSRAEPACRNATLGRVSVVMMARDAASSPFCGQLPGGHDQSRFDLCHRQPRADHHGRHDRAGARRQSCAASALAAIAAASSNPASPVHALAQPELIATARKAVGRSASSARLYSTGAAAENALRVNTAAALQGRSLMINARSAAPVFLMPAATPANGTPGNLDAHFSLA